MKSNVPSRLAEQNEPSASSWLCPESRLLLLVVALTAGLAVAVTQLRTTANSRVSISFASAIPTEDTSLRSVTMEPLDSVARSRPLMATPTTLGSTHGASDDAFGTTTRVGGGLRGRDQRPGSSGEPGIGQTDGGLQPQSSGASTSTILTSMQMGAAAPPTAAAATAVLGIAHRGASAEFPEHTREAYELAVAEGADFIECDVVLSRDLVPLCRHEPNLVGSTDAAVKFPDRWRTYSIDGEQVEGIFSVDLTAEEVATLRAVQPWPFRNQSYNGRLRVATLADYLDVAKSANRSVGIYPETKHPSWTNSLPTIRAAGTSLEDILLKALAAAGFGAPMGSEAWARRPVFLQSFEAGSLRYLAARSCAPTVLLLGDWEGWVAPDSGMTLEQLTGDSALGEIAGWAAAVGAAKGSLLSWQPGLSDVETGEEAAVPGGLRRLHEGGGSGGGGDGGGRYVSSGLVERFRSHGLQVHTYTLRPETRFLLPHLPALNVSAEYDLLLLGPGEAGGAVAVDGVFADFMPSFQDWQLRHHRGNDGSWQQAPQAHGGGGIRLDEGQGALGGREVAGAVARGIRSWGEALGRTAARARGEESSSRAAGSGRPGRRGREGPGVAGELDAGAGPEAPDLHRRERAQRKAASGERLGGLHEGDENGGRRGWLPGGGSRVWSDELKCLVYQPPGPG